MNDAAMNICVQGLKILKNCGKIHVTKLAILTILSVQFSGIKYSHTVV